MLCFPRTRAVHRRCRTRLPTPRALLRLAHCWVAAAEGSTSACDSQRSMMLTRPGSAVMAKSRQPAVPRASSTTLTQPVEASHEASVARTGRVRAGGVAFQVRARVHITPPDQVIVSSSAIGFSSPANDGVDRQPSSWRTMHQRCGLPGGTCSPVSHSSIAALNTDRRDR
jgi:hypothetical protein